MEKSSPPLPAEQRGDLKPLRLKLTIGKLQGYSWSTPARLKEIGKSPSKLKAFQARNPSLSHLARIADITGARGQFPPGCSAIDDVREAMVAGDFELFFSVITVYRSDALRDCLQDPTISRIIREWEQDAGSGNQDARALLLRIGTALGRATYRRPPLSATKQPVSNRNAVAVFNIVAPRLRRYIAFRKTRLPAEARALIEDELEKNRRIVPERKPAILAAFRRKARKWEETRSGHQALI